MSQNKEKIVAAGKDLAASGQSSSELELDSQPKMWRVIESANAELASLGVSVAWDRETSTVVYQKVLLPLLLPLQNLSQKIQNQRMTSLKKKSLLNGDSKKTCQSIKS
tara:strand:- start:81 stop:404 length:324 start_codon:yes stop_codon:yes gene_type:complete